MSRPVAPSSVSGVLLAAQARWKKIHFAHRGSGLCQNTPEVVYFFFFIFFFRYGCPGLRKIKWPSVITLEGSNYSGPKVLLGSNLGPCIVEPIVRTSFLHTATWVFGCLYLIKKAICHPLYAVCSILLLGPMPSVMTQVVYSAASVYILAPSVWKYSLLLLRCRCTFAVTT